MDSPKYRFIEVPILSHCGCSQGWNYRFASPFSLSISNIIFAGSLYSLESQILINFFIEATAQEENVEFVVSLRPNQKRVPP